LDCGGKRHAVGVLQICCFIFQVSLAAACQGDLPRLEPNENAISLSILIFCLSLTGFAQTKNELRLLESVKSIEREIAGGESHIYQINLTAGQFARFRLDQHAVDAVLILSAPDGKQLVEMNLTGFGEQESLSLKATSAGSYGLTVRALGVTSLHGSYRLETTVTAAATATDHKLLAAEALLVEASELRKQSGKTAQQVIDKLQPALPLWRELGEPAWTAYSLSLIVMRMATCAGMRKQLSSTNRPWQPAASSNYGHARERHSAFLACTTAI